MTTASFAAMTRSEKDRFNDHLHRAQTQFGLTLGEMTDAAPELVVFLRHSGCVFTREALRDLQRARPTIGALGAGVVLVHMELDSVAEALFARYGLEGIPRISDPNGVLYGVFGLGRGRFRHWLRLGSLWGVLRAFVSGHRLGRITADVLQMPGVFLVWQGEIVGAFRHRSISDRPDYAKLASRQVQE